MSIVSHQTRNDGVGIVQLRWAIFLAVCQPNAVEDVWFLQILRCVLHPDPNSSFQEVVVVVVDVDRQGTVDAQANRHVDVVPRENDHAALALQLAGRAVYCLPFRSKP